jgi:hypothetical protein
VSCYRPVSATIKLSRGDVLSYSSGTASRDPYGFRVARPGGDLLELLRGRWPELLRDFGERLPLVINAYPAGLGSFASAVFVDSYLSHATASRALELASREGMPVVLLGQPLFVADLLLVHTSRQLPLPDALLLGLGGYTTPRSLEDCLRALCAAHGARLSLFHGYGVAEVDAACLIAVRRSESGALLYEKRGPDVVVTLRDNELLLARGESARPFATGDRARLQGEALVIWNDTRLAPAVSALLESWTHEDWHRRTGYLRHGAELRVQLRTGVAPDPRCQFEVGFEDFARECGHAWLLKPRWSVP